MNTKIIMVRHGETDWNVLCRFLGSADRPLTEKGRRQAGYAAKALENEQIDVIYSSPMQRAYETGVIIRGDRKIDIIPDPELREIDCGAWEGMTGEEVEAIYPGQIDLWGNHPEQLVIDRGETFQQVQDRVIAEFWNIVRANRGKTILITSHMISLTLIMLYFAGKEISEMWDMRPLANAGLNELEVDDDDNVEIVTWSDDSFVPEEEKVGSSLVAGKDSL